MIRYGQIVKLVKPQELRVMDRYKNLISDLKESFSYTTKSYPTTEKEKTSPNWRVRVISLRERGGFQDYFFTIPSGTLCILSQGIVDSHKEDYKVFIANPKRKNKGRSLRNLGLSLKHDDFTIFVSKDELELMREIQKDFILFRKRQIDNLQMVERLDDLQTEVTSDQS